MPGVGDQHDPRPALDLRDELAGALDLVLLVVGDEARAAKLEPLVEAPGAAGVLAGDQVGLLERPQRARGLRSSRLPIGVGQTVSRPGHQRGCPDQRFPRAPSRRRRSSPPPARARRRRTSVSFIGAQRAGAQLPPGGLEQQLARRRRAAADHDHVGLEDVREAGERDARGGGRCPSTTSTAIPSPASAASVTVLPLISLAARRAPARAPTPGAPRPRARPARPSAVPEASASTQPWLGQLPWQRGPFSSITMWPSSAPAPVVPR